MRILIVPLSDDLLGSAGCASDLADALQNADVPVQSVQVVRDDVGLHASAADVVHFIADTVARAADLSAAGEHGLGDTPHVVTILDAEAEEPDAGLPELGAETNIVVLTESARSRLERSGARHSGMDVVPAAVPLPCAVTQPAEAPTILFQVPRMPPASLLSEAIGALSELPRDVSITLAADPALVDVGAVEQAVGAVARSEGVAGRAHVVGLSTHQAVHEAIARSAAVIAAYPIVAGPWHAFAPLAYGKPLLAFQHDLFRDLMLRGHCVRTVDPHKPGHLRSCLRAILGNPVGMEEMRDRGQRFAAQHTPAIMARQMIAVYRRIIAERPMEDPHG